MRNLFHTLNNLISLELRNSRHWNLEVNPVNRHAMFVHNATVYFLLVFAAFYCVDLFLAHAYVSNTVLEALDLASRYGKYLVSGQLKLFYLASFLISLVLCPFFGLHFYVTKGRDVTRDLFISKRIINDFVSNVIAFLGGSVFLVLFFLGGYLLAIILPQGLSLSEIPGFGVLQVLLIVKIQAYLAISINTLFLMTLPYSPIK